MAKMMCYNCKVFKKNVYASSLGYFCCTSCEDQFRKKQGKKWRDFKKQESKR